eukprot:745070-Rhodomonas_salina.1
MEPLAVCHLRGAGRAVWVPAHPISGGDEVRRREVILQATGRSHICHSVSEDWAIEVRRGSAMRS